MSARDSRSRTEEWPGLDSSIGRFVEAQAERTLAGYREQPAWIEEHVGIEEAIRSGGYGHRQIYELVQNAADAIEEAREYKRNFTGRVAVVLTDEALYCANQGSAIDVDGALSILTSHISRKRGHQIGHFGLGFKSVLGVSSRPEVFSRSGSFGFDAKWAAERIRSAVPSAHATPTLRVARALDPHAASVDDPVLSQLMEWATTVVRLPRDVVGTEWLSEDLASFPAGFLLFCSHVSELQLDDRLADVTRVLRAREREGVIRLTNDGVRSRWRVFATEVSIDSLPAEAKEDAYPHVLERGTLPLVWAVQINPQRRERGRFWAFFPTETETTLSGILNAPWKTNSDRENLLDGPFNRALIERAVGMVAANLTSLHDPEDPGGLFDILPARAEDARSWADRKLAETLDKALADVPFVATTDGKLRLASAVFLRPEPVVAARETLAEDHELLERRGGWCHWTVEQRERRAKARRLGTAEGGIAQWLTAFTPQISTNSSIRALRALDVVKGWLDAVLRETARTAPIILTVDRELVPATTPSLFLGQDDGTTGWTGTFVDTSITRSEVALRSLRWLGVDRLKPAVVLRNVLRQDPVNWELIWHAARECEPQEAADVLLAFKPSWKWTPDPLDRWPGPRVRTLDGKFRPVAATLLPGRIVSPDASQDADVFVDLEFHDKDRELLTRVGAVQVPATLQPCSQAAWFHEFRSEARTRLLAQLPPVGSRPHEDKLQFDRDQCLGPLDSFSRLSSDGRLAFTSHLLEHCLSETRWVMQHSTRPGSYPRVECDGPVRWNLKKHGVLATTQGPKPVADCVGMGLSRWGDVLPVVGCSQEQQQWLELPSSLEALTSQQWANALEAVLETVSDSIAGAFYAAASPLLHTPATIRCAGGFGQAPPSQVAVVWDESSLAAHVAAGVRVVLAPDREGAQRLRAEWGMAEAAVSIGFVADDDAQFLLDAFPTLSPFVSRAVGETRVQRCKELWYEITTVRGSIRQSAQHAQRDDFCYVDSSADQRIVFEFLRAALALPLTDDQLTSLVADTDRRELDERLERVRAETDLARKLAAALGPERIRRKLPESIAAFHGAVPADGIDDATRLGALALAVFGVEVLRQYSDELTDAGFDPPRQWAGTARALEFVDDLGFPPEYAGFESSKYPPAVDVDGPLQLNPLHAFQETVAKRIAEFVQEARPARGLLSLPTGAGKTRVVVEALIRSLKAQRLSGCLVWIAQSSELCEQAVQSWSQAWRAFGPATTLHISRLWGSTNNRVVPTPDQVHVVVATYQSLERRVHEPSYGWLRAASCVVIDEAHGSTAPSYTRILDAFGVTARETMRPLIGVTATPFRGAADPAETQWLVNRYGQRRFDLNVIDGDDPYPALQEMGVLARVDHQELPGNALTLSEAQIAHLIQFHVLPPEVEHVLGLDLERNQRVVESISTLPGEWSVLVFATSVDHARLLAAMLCLRGIPAKPISAETDSGARRFYVEEFRRGRVRVLTNYNVLATGFDAPAVRALYITRPVYSKLLYQQMIGRGLRGPLNGGKEWCRIVNIADNVVEYGEQLAFRHFEPLWRGEQVGV